MAEKLRLVRSFSELGPGMLVVIRPCHWCGRTHRAIIVSRSPSEAKLSPDGQMLDDPAWDIEPSVSCHRRYTKLCISARTVKRNVVHIVDTGNDDTAEQEEGRRDARESADSIAAKKALMDLADDWERGRW